MKPEIVALTVAYGTHRWFPTFLRTYRTHLSDVPLIAVDNNPDPRSIESRWLIRQTDLILLRNEGPTRSHGEALDAALPRVREIGAKYLLHLEPDCVIRGLGWLELLRNAIEEGAWMAGSHRKSFGPIHVTPSLWRIDEIRHPFDIQPREPDESHPRFAELFDRLRFNTFLTGKPPSTREWCDQYWDCGQKLWFEAAVRDRAVLVPKTRDFLHFWRGTRSRPNPRTYVRAWLDAWRRAAVQWWRATLLSRYSTGS